MGEVIIFFLFFSSFFFFFLENFLFPFFGGEFWGDGVAIGLLLLLVLEWLATATFGRREAARIPTLWVLHEKGGK